MSGIPIVPIGRPLPLHHPSALPLRRLGVIDGGYANITSAMSWKLPADAITVVWVIDPGWHLDGAALGHPWLWILPPSVHQHVITIPAGGTLLWFGLARHGRWAALCAAGVHPRDPGGRDRHDTTHVLVRRWLSETGAPWMLADRVARDLGDALAAILERRLHVLSAPGLQRHAEGLEALWRQVQEDPVGPWPLGRLARMTGCSPSHLHRLCLMGSGLPPVQLVADIRLRRAADFLQAGDRTIEQVAGLVGYSSAAALSKAYHRRFGVRPGSRRR